MLAILFVTLVSCNNSAATDSMTTETPTVSQAKAELRNLIEDVTDATASRYGATDDRGNVMDTAKIIAIPESGGFAGVYHSFRADSNTFATHLATSDDLMNWTWQRQLADNASMPAIKPASDSGYVVAWEQEPDNHVKLAYFENWDELRAGSPAQTFDAPRELSTCAEGTPNLYAASRTAVDIGFHYYRDCDADRQARGETDWQSWTATTRPSLDAAIEAHDVVGNIGDRDVIHFQGHELMLIEGRSVKEDWQTWRVFLYDEESGDAEPLDIRTDAGSTAFANPTITAIEIDSQTAIVVTLFIPSEASNEAEAGQLIYYRTYEPVEPR